MFAHTHNGMKILGKKAFFKFMQNMMTCDSPIKTCQHTRFYRETTCFLCLDEHQKIKKKENQDPFLG